MPRKDQRLVPGSRVYQLKITVSDIRPPIWRRLCVPGDITLLRLHFIIQDSFGSTDCHLHEFVVDGLQYGDPRNYEERGPGFKYCDESLSTLEKLVRREKMRFRYVYDFGDYWAHEVVAEKIEETGPGDEQPVCLSGRRHRPPEDCGGPTGYANFMDAIRDPAHEEHQDCLEWVGGAFEPEAFDIEAVNRVLSFGKAIRDHQADWGQ